MDSRAACCARVVALALSFGGTMTAVAQGTFEGTVTGTFSTDGKTIPFRYAQLGSRTRQEYTIEGNTAVSVFDGTTGDMISIMPQQKKYLVMNLRQASGAMRQMANAMTGGGRKQDLPDFTKMKVTPTGQHETIAGVGCDHYLFQSTDSTAQHTLDMCGAAGMGFMGIAGQTASMMPSTAALLRSQNPELAKLARQGFFPLKMIITSEHGQSVWSVAQLDRHRPDAALFQPPAGYAELKVPGMGGHE